MKLATALICLASVASASPPEEAKRERRQLDLNPETAFMRELSIDEDADFWTRELSSHGSMGVNKHDYEFFEEFGFEVEVICDDELAHPRDVARLEDAVLSFSNDFAECNGKGVAYSSFTLLDFSEAEICREWRLRRQLRRVQRSVVTGQRLGCRGCRNRDDASPTRRILGGKDSEKWRCAGAGNCDSPCTDKNIRGNRLYHDHCSDPEKFLQCDGFGGCFVKDCAPGTVWSQEHQTCVHGRVQRHKKAKCDEADLLIASFLSRGFDNVKEVEILKVKEQDCSAGTSDCEDGSACCGADGCRCEKVSPSLCVTKDCDLPGADCCSLPDSVWWREDTEELTYGAYCDTSSVYDDHAQCVKSDLN